ncbi:type II secretion system protein GspL [Pseudomonas luteola]|uniref:type II secretion system protein GspL n=1 Tax=Pseudomonas luteola TaxID=47886 RepID=UPI00388DEFD4
MPFIFLPPESSRDFDQSLIVRYLDEADRLSSLTLNECAALLGAAKVTLVIPAEVVTSCLVSLPTQKARLVRQALPFAVEELLAEEIELFHLALGGQQADGRYRVLAINRALLASWLNQFKDMSVSIAAIYTDADLLTGEGEQILFLDERGLIGGACETRLAFATSVWAHLQPLCLSPTVIESPTPYQHLSQGTLQAINLAQGEFAPNGEPNAWSVWRPFALLLVLWLVVHLGFTWYQAWEYKQRGDIYAQENLKVYKELFPQDHKVVNIRAQFEEHLMNLNKSAVGVIEILGKLSEVGGEIKFSILQMDYKYEETFLRVLMKDFSMAERMGMYMEEAGFNFDVDTVTPDGSGFLIDVKIKKSK